MAKNSKTLSSNGAAQVDDSAAAAPVTKARKRAKSSAKTAGKVSNKKTAAPSAPKKAAPRRSAKKEAAEPTEPEIRLRAYFIAERRAQLGHEGDPSNDWLDARQQLIDEAAQGGSH